MTMSQITTTSNIHGIGTYVRWRWPDSGRGIGQIVAYNESQGMFYNKERYPYIIHWSDGYEDVYDADSFTVVDDEPHFGLEDNLYR